LFSAFGRILSEILDKSIVFGDSITQSYELRVNKNAFFEQTQKHRFAKSGVLEN